MTYPALLAEEGGVTPIFSYYWWRTFGHPAVLGDFTRGCLTPGTSAFPAPWPVGTVTVDSGAPDFPSGLLTVRAVSPDLAPRTPLRTTI